MYLAIKQVRKKQKERQQRKTVREQAEQEPGCTLEPIDAERLQPTINTNVKDGLDEAERTRRKRYRWRLMFGLFFPYMLQALDMTIIASALPYIALAFNEVKQLNWIVSAFNLASVAFLPFWAQLADIYGRYHVLLASIAVIMVGSAIATGAPTSAFGVLLLGRALQGVGAAGIAISERIILADKVSLHDYAVNWTVFALVGGIGFSIGPVIGGFLTETSWRWCFAVNLPVGILAIVLVVLLLGHDLLGPQPLPGIDDEANQEASGRSKMLRRLLTIDYGGQLLFLFGLGLVVLALTWAAGTYPWTSPAVLAPLVIGCVLLGFWLLYERLMAPPHSLSRIIGCQRAMIPWELLVNRNIGLLFVVNFALGQAMFAVLYFTDLYFALVQGRSAGNSGVALLYFLPGLGIGAYMAMFSSNVWPRQTLPALLLGGVTSAVGITVLAWAMHTSHTSVVYGMMALTGHGVGIRMNPGSLHALAYFPTMTAPITCLVAIAWPLGGTFALTIMDTVFNNLAGSQTEDMIKGITYAFVAMIPFMWVCVLVTMCLGNVWISKEGGHEVFDGVYLWSVVTGKQVIKQKRMRGGEFEGTALDKESKAMSADEESPGDA